MTDPFTLARLGAPGEEIPAVRHAGRTLDARSVTSDFDPTFFASNGLVRVADALDSLPEREQTILRLRFFEDLTQAEIADRVGVSQMHVSRLLARSLASLRQQLRTAER